jgi:hypothetical protein
VLLDALSASLLDEELLESLDVVESLDDEESLDEEESLESLLGWIGSALAAETGSGASSLGAHACAVQVSAADANARIR